MNTGTQASEGIGIRALASGMTKFSTGLKRAIAAPSGTASAIARPRPVSTRVSVAKACCSMVPSSSAVTRVPITVGKVGSRAGGK